MVSFTHPSSRYPLFLSCIGSVKAGLLLSLFGGAPKERIGGASTTTAGTVAIRRDVHCLVVGDPGLGKSQMLKAMCNIAPRGVYVCGNTTTTAGLTVTVVREASGDFALEAGALVLGDRGVCCIDEFDKMGADHGALLEAMEQQSVSVAKAGLLCNLSARTTVIAAANPVGGHYDRSKTVCENLKIALPLLSRFDLVFILLDSPDEDRDRFISEHVMAMFGMRSTERQRTRGGGVGAAADPYHARKDIPSSLIGRMRERTVSDPLPPSLFRQYIAYARAHVHPELSEGAKRVLQEFYLTLRKGAHEQAADTTPITTRQLESLIRLSEARARAVMRTVVTEDDARDVIEISMFPNRRFAVHILCTPCFVDFLSLT
jgi:DNA helicase MCM8